MGSGFVSNQIFLDRIAEYQNLSLSSGSSASLARADFLSNGGGQYTPPAGYEPIGFAGIWGGANKVSIRMLSLYPDNAIMMNVKNIYTSDTGYVNPSVSPVYVKSDFLTDLDGDE